MTTNLAKKIGNISTVVDNRAYSNRESGENRCSDDYPQQRVGIA